MSVSADFQRGMTTYKSSDFATVLREWKPLAQQGNSVAQSGLGVMHQNGLGVSKNNKTALRWFRLAAKQGYAYAQYALGVMYAKGEGVPKNDKTAVK